MNKSELIEAMSLKQPHLSAKDVEAAVNTILEQITQRLSEAGRVETRGFGSFSVHTHRPHTGRNPRTGELVEVEAKQAIRFKPGKELRDRVNVDFKAVR